MRISYAQLMEDFCLERVLGERSKGFYVDIGGGHPVADNVSFLFYLKGWHGLVVEPQSELAALYAGLRPRDVVRDHLVGSANGEVPFHRVERLHGFSTMLETHAAGASAFGAGYRTERKPVRPLAEVLAELGHPRIDFMKVDVEGAEAEVLAGMDWSLDRPSVLCIEAIRPGTGEAAESGWEPLLDAARYRFAFSDGLNRYYVREEEAALAARFPASPLPWDSARHLYEFGRPHLNRDHPDHALADALARGLLAALPRLEPGFLLDLLARGSDEGAARKLLGLSESGMPDDVARAALGRIAAAYDGGMIWDDEQAGDEVSPSPS